VLSSPASTPDCPLLIDPSGLWLRPEGKYWIAGMPPQADLPDLPLEPDHAQFQSLWETLAARIPAMEALRAARMGWLLRNEHPRPQCDYWSAS
jgi:glycine/D-amino acid oxidase-like deaminating enzyme